MGRAILTGSSLQGTKAAVRILAVQRALAVMARASRFNMPERGACGRLR